MLYLAAAALLFSGAPVRAQPDGEQDVVVLRSGNRLLGELRALNRGELAFRIAGARPIEIDWRNIESLASNQRLDVETASGERFLGTVASPAPGRLDITTDTGTATVEIQEVIRLQPIAASFRARTEGSIDLGFDLIGANDELDLTLHVEAQNRTQNYLTKAALDSLLRELNDETAQRRNRLDVNVRRFLGTRWFVLGDFIAEENLELGLDARLLAAAAAGRTLVQSNRNTLALYAGLAYDLERYAGVPGTEREPEALGSIEWDWFEFGGNMELSSQATLYVGLDRSRRRFQADVQLRRMLAGAYYWSLTLYESYDSDPPADLENEDQGLNITIGRSF